VAKKEDLAKEPHKIIVSMSHAGEVKNLTTKKLGGKVEIVSAAGAGQSASRGHLTSRPSKRCVC